MKASCQQCLYETIIAKQNKAELPVSESRNEIIHESQLDKISKNHMHLRAQPVGPNSSHASVRSHKKLSHLESISVSTPDVLALVALVEAWVTEPISSDSQQKCMVDHPELDTAGVGPGNFGTAAGRPGDNWAANGIGRGERKAEDCRGDGGRWNTWGSS